MTLTSPRRAFASVAALLFVAGCSSASSPVATNTQTLPSTQSTTRNASGSRWVAGPAIQGPQFVSVVHSTERGYVSPDRRRHHPILYVVDANNAKVLLYNPNIRNPKSTGQITDGLSCPGGAAIDSAGTLYVANGCNNTVTLYPKGKTSPSFTIDSGMNSPYGIGVDAQKDVFVSNLGNNTITGYKPGATTPFETVSGVGPNPVGVAVNAAGDVYVADDSDNHVYVIPAGSSTAHDSGLTGMNGPIGVSFTANDTLYVSNFAANTVGVYPKGATSPSSTITNGISAPTLSGFTKSGSFFQAEQSGPVVGYKKGQSSPFSTISGIPRPLGVASSPRGSV